MTHCRICFLWLLLTAPTCGEEAPTWQQLEQQRIETLQRIAPTVVCVMPPGGEGGGSGVLISTDGYAVTNHHVTMGAGPFLKCGLNDGQVYDAVIAGIDPTGDQALIRLLGRDDFPAAEAGNSDLVRAGDEVMALGNPFLLAEDFTPTVTYGIVSGVHRYQYPAKTFLEYTDCIQIDASINPGNSGGPLFDIHGRWIGINGRASFEQRGRVNVGAAYAISVRQVQLFLNHLKSGRVVDHGTAEFSVRTDSTGRVLVSEIVEISEAWRRGLREGDELISFAGRALTSANDFKNILGIFPASTRVPLEFQSRDSRRSISIRLRPLHEFQEIPDTTGPQEPPPHGTPKEQDEPSPAEQKWAHLFEARDGFSNYAFNRTHQVRLLQPLQQTLSRFDQLNSTWDLTLQEEDSAEPMQLTVSSAGAGLTQKGTPWHQSADSLDPTAEPPEWPGILTACIQWHQLFCNPLQESGDPLYVGSERHLETNRLVHVLESTHGSRRCRWLFPEDQELPFGVDVLSGAGQDEARLIFEDWNHTSPLPVPRRVGVIHPHDGQLRWLTVSGVELRS